nr:hypothetical protein [Hankyongella ginsenosidimutans]
MLVNASTWALLLTGRVVEMDPDLSRDPPGWFGRLVNRLGEPVIRQAVRQAMRIMGGEFVMGQTIEQRWRAAARSRRRRACARSTCWARGTHRHRCCAVCCSIPGCDCEDFPGRPAWRSGWPRHLGQALGARPALP